MTCDKCKEKIKSTIKNVPGLDIVSIDVPSQRVVLDVQTKCAETIMDIQNRIEKDTGIRTVVKGVGDRFTGVAEIFGPDDLVGVVRLGQMPENKCYIDGVVDNVRLKSEKTGCSLNIHEFGDLRGEDFEHVGPVKVELMKNVRPIKDRCLFKGYADDCDLSSMIGRAMIVSDGGTSKHLGAGIVARSSPIFGNVKKICECSGKTLWEERREKASHQV